MYIFNQELFSAVEFHSFFSHQVHQMKYKQPILPSVFYHSVLCFRSKMANQSHRTISVQHSQAWNEAGAVLTWLNLTDTHPGGISAPFLLPLSSNMKIQHQVQIQRKNVSGGFRISGLAVVKEVTTVSKGDWLAHSLFQTSHHRR